MLPIIPAPASAMTKAVPPWLTKRSGSPESGTTPIMADMFKNDSEMTRTPKPIAIMLAKALSDLFAIRNRLAPNNIYTRMSNTPPIKPNSSAATANIESSVGCGR